MGDQSDQDTTLKMSNSDRATIRDAASLFGDMAIKDTTSSNSRRTTNYAERLLNSHGSLAPTMSNSSTPNHTAPSSPNPKIILHTTPRRSSIPELSDPGSNSSKFAKLEYKTSFGGKMEFSLAREETTIGRKEDNNIVLTCAKISKYHGMITRKNQQYHLVDKNSSNGIKVNGTTVQPSTPYELRAGDSILIGTILLSFIHDHEEEPSRESVTRPRRDAPGIHRGYRSRTLNDNLNGSKFAKAKEDHKNDNSSYLNLVTILPSEEKYDETMTIRAEMQADDEVDFKKVEEVQDISMIKEDYEKLRLAYELSKVSLTHDITSLLEKSMDLIFGLVPVDRGVVLLVDQNTGILGTHYVKLREGTMNEKREILLSSTILRKVYYSRMCLITSDAYEDPMLGKAASVKHGQIRSVICVPLIAHNKVHGILHLDSRDRINNFSNKDLSLVKAISNQTAIAIENSILIKEVENKAKITEQLSRFLAPHVVDRMVNKAEIIKKGGREIVGTIVFVDIRGFTNFSEACGPMETVNLLNDYFERLVDIVFKYDGIVDKYIGDALMAVFGTLEEEKDPEFRAVAACLDFKRAIAEMNEERVRNKKDPITIGVGVNTGELLAGFIGCSQRLEYTCIGDTVNTSSRICSMADKDQVVMSEFTYEKVKDKVVVKPIGMRQFKGKEKEVMVYEVLHLK